MQATFALTTVLLMFIPIVICLLILIGVVILVVYLVKNQRQPAQPENSPGTYKQLTRSSGNRMICGVCGGFGEYFNIDPTLIRVGYVIATLFSGIFIGILAYFITALIVPTAKQ